MAALVELRQRPEVRRALDIVRPGDTITFTDVDGALQSLNRQISNTLTLSVARSDDGFAVNYIENPLETEIVGRRARITSSLFAAGQGTGMSAEKNMSPPLGDGSFAAICVVPLDAYTMAPSEPSS